MNGSEATGSTPANGQSSGSAQSADLTEGLSEFQRLRMLIDSIDAGLGLLAPDFTILELNDEAMRIDGRLRYEVIGKSHWEAYPGSEHSPIGELYKTIMKDRQSGSLTHLYHWPDGRVEWFETRAFPVAGGCMGIFYRDVTEQRNAGFRLQQSEQRFRAAVDAIQGVLWTNNANGEMIGEQPKWAELTGQTFDQYQGYGWAEAVHPDDAQPTIEAWQASVRSQTPFNFEHRIRRHDGEWRLCAIRAVPVLDDDGNIREWVGVHRDVTDRHRAQDLLARNAETFTNLVVSNPFGIYVVDADFKLTNVSRGARKVFENIIPLSGRDFAEVLRLVWAEPFASEAIGHFRDTLATGTPYVSETTIKQRADIDAIEAYDWRIERIVLPDGRFGVVCYFYDLSERNSYEEQLKLLVREKEMLAREIDHRVKNSLAIVGSLLSMQRSATESDETRTALTEAVNRVVAVSRVHERLHKSQQVGIIAFAEYLEKLCKDISSSLGGQGVTLDFAAEPVELPVEQAMSLALIANELVTNAFKHGCAAGAKRIAVTLSRAAETLLLVVADDGAGLPAAEGTKSAGLGFKVIKTLSKQLGAVLTLPKPGSAAEFQVAVPYRAAAGVAA